MVEVAKLRVRYQETDQMGIVYNANYLTWFEIGRTEFCRQLGINYRQMEAEGVFLPVTEAYCKYKSPAYYDDLITVAVTIQKLTAVRIKFSYSVFREQQLLVTGETVHAFTDKEGKLLKLSRDYPEIWHVLTNAVHNK